jgi:hypothetical protein
MILGGRRVFTSIFLGGIFFAPWKKSTQLMAGTQHMASEEFSDRHAAASFQLQFFNA